MIKELTREILDKAPYIWLPTPYIYTAWWPWVKNYSGELRAGAVRPGPIYARIWVDQDLKKKMGHVTLSRWPSPLLSVRNLSTRFRTDRGTVQAVDGVSFDVAAGETLAIVGESGSGKSVTALSILRLIPDPPGRIEEGEILFEGKDLLKLDDAGIRAIRGDRIAMIFQEPMSSLNPALTVGNQIGEPINLHRKTPWAKALDKAARASGARCAFPTRRSRLDAYPHQYLRRHAPARR